MSSVKSKKFAESLFASISKIDKLNLKQDFDSWASLARTSWDSSQPQQLERTYGSILFVGMGGSGIVGDIIADLASEQESYRVDVLKDYHLPKYYTSDTLIIGLSSSGDTEETISVLNEASRKGFDICSFGSGGLMEKMSISNPRIKFTKTKMLKVPRTSFPGLFYPVLKFLIQNGLLRISDDHVNDSINYLARVNELASKQVVKQNKALEIAVEVSSKGALPLIYSSRRTRAVGMRFRQSLNENSKIHAYDGILPELCHNEIVAWDYFKTAKAKKPVASNAIPIALKLEDDPIEIRTRFQIVEEILKKAKTQLVQVPSIGTTYLSRIISMLYLLDYASYFASLLRGVDPILTPSIDLLKSELKTRLNFLGRTTQ